MLRHFLRLYGPLFVIVVVGLIVALFFVAPPPPKHITIAGGAAGGAYAATANAWAAALAKEKVKADVLETAGSVDNLRLLMEGKAQIGIVQTGVAGQAGAHDVASLGAIFYEPLWVFHRANVPVNDLGDLKGRKVAVGPEGSGVRVLSTALLAEAGLQASGFTASALSGAAAATALQKGEIDAAMIVSGASPPWLASLAGDPSIRLLSMHRANALNRLHPFLDTVTVYEGVLDVARNVPDHDATLISPSAQIVVRQDLHPAIQALLLDIAADTHHAGTSLAPPGRFPAKELVDVPLSAEAARYYKDGPSFLRRLFPFAVANFLERAWILAIPLLTLLFPIIRAAPPIYRWSIRRRIYVWYRDLRALEASSRAATTDEERAVVRNRLEELQAETGKVEVPLSYTDDLYRLRLHIAFVSDLLIDPHAAVGKHVVA